MTPSFFTSAASAAAAAMGEALKRRHCGVRARCAIRRDPAAKDIVVFGWIGEDVLEHYCCVLWRRKSSHGRLKPFIIALTSVAGSLLAEEKP